MTTLFIGRTVPVKHKEEVPEAPVKKRPPRKEMERDRGQYFIQPFVGLAFMSSDASFNRFNGFDGLGILLLDIEIETKVGHAIWIGLGPVQLRRRNSFLLMPLSVMILPRLPMVVLPLRYLYPVKSNFFKLVPELATASCRRIRLDSGGGGIRLRQKA